MKWKRTKTVASIATSAAPVKPAEVPMPKVKAVTDFLAGNCSDFNGKSSIFGAPKQSNAVQEAWYEN